MGINSTLLQGTQHGIATLQRDLALGRPAPH
jgi:hypothetical protein